MMDTRPDIACFACMASFSLVGGGGAFALPSLLAVFCDTPDFLFIHKIGCYAPEVGYLLFPACLQPFAAHLPVT